MFQNIFAFYDLESTGSNPRVDAVISIGCVLTSYNRKQFHVIDTFHTLVSTTQEIDPEAQHVHHISAGELVGKPSFPETMVILENWWTTHLTPTSRVLLVAHNGRKFDDIMLYCNFEKHQLNFTAYLKRLKVCGFLDTLVMLKDMTKRIPKRYQARSKTTERFSLALGACYYSWCGQHEIINAHNAMADCMALVKVMNAPIIAPKLNIIAIFTYVVHATKALKQISQSMGLSLMTIVSTHAPHSNQPKWKNGLCLNCVSFHKHEIC
jgi:DNA polymerase III epsilon subunit-like protein